MADSQIIELTLTLDNVEPAVMRRLAVPLDLGLDRLHLTIQAAMGWENAHMYEFAWKNRAWVMDDAAPEEDRLPARSTRLADLIAAITGKTFRYTYDFGDSWDHTIKLGKVSAPALGALYPALIEATNACPPEDCGGPPGYEWLLSVLADPSHAEYQDLSDWAGQIDPADAQLAKRQAKVAALAKKWAPKPRKAKVTEPS